MLEFREKEYGNLPIPSQQADGEELIFMSNEQTIIESDHIARHASTSKRKPDIIAIFTSTLNKYCTNQPKTKFQDWVRLVSDDWSSNLLLQKFQWLDVHQSWELDVKHRHDQDLQEEETKSQDPVQPLSENRKRRSDESLSGDKKRTRVSNLDSENKASQALDNDNNLVPDLRCAYYAIERLRAACHVTHSMAVLLEG